jgi:hypothetical protein
MRKTKIIIGTLLTTATLALASPAMASAAEPAAPASALGYYRHGPYVSQGVCQVWVAHEKLLGYDAGNCWWEPTPQAGTPIGWYFLGE